MLQVEKISKTYGDKKVLHNLSFTVKQGEMVAILGKSGAGKTTLFEVISGLQLPDGGRILLQGKEVTGMPGKVGYMTQKDFLLPHKTLLDNVALPLILQKKCTKQEGREQVAPLFLKFGLQGQELQYPSEISGGMAQRVALMRAVVSSQEMILLDEPFSALDEHTKQEIQQWYKKIAKEMHLTTLFITHNKEEARSMAQRILMFSEIGFQLEEQRLV